IALIELAAIGRKQASSAYDLNTAQLLCQAKLDEIVAELAPAKPGEDQELEDNPGWLYSIEIEPIRLGKLVSVKVSVYQEEDESRRPVRFTLVRWLPGSVFESSNAPSETLSARNSTADPERSTINSTARNPTQSVRNPSDPLRPNSRRGELP